MNPDNEHIENVEGDPLYESIEYNSANRGIKEEAGNIIDESEILNRTFVESISSKENSPRGSTTSPGSKVVTRSKGRTEFLVLNFEKRTKGKMSQNNAASTSKPEGGTRSSESGEDRANTRDFDNENYVDMNTCITLTEALGLIPSSASDESNINKFIEACDIAMGTIEGKYRSVLLKCILTRLNGKASEAIKYKDTSTWGSVKANLKEAFEKDISVSTLQDELNAICMREN